MAYQDAIGGGEIDPSVQMKCRTKFCRGTPAASSKKPYCAKCSMRRWKEKHPEKYAFHKLRSRAKERGHKFTLTFEDYVRFARTTGYFEKKGKTAMSLSIDRIDPRRGYEPDNIRAMTLSMNSRFRYAPMSRVIREQYEAMLNNEPF